MFTTTLALMLLTAEPSLTVSGDLPKPTTLTVKQLEAVGHDSGPKGKGVPKGIKVQSRSG